MFRGISRLCFAIRPRERIIFSKRSSHWGSSNTIRRGFSKVLVYGLLTAGGVGICYGSYVCKNPPEQLPHCKSKKNLVILGTGWGSTTLLEAIDTQEYNVTLVSPMSSFVFTPLLPSYLAGNASLDSLATPIRYIASSKKRAVKYINGSCFEINPKDKLITVLELPLIGEPTETKLKYDYLVIGTGTKPADLNVSGISKYAIPVKDPMNFKLIRDEIVDRADRTSAAFASGDSPSDEFNIVIVGGGPTGVELSATIREFIDEHFKKWHFHPEIVPKVTLIESQDRVLPGFQRKTSDKVTKVLNKSNVNLMTDSVVVDVKKDSVTVSSRNGSNKSKLPCDIVIIATGEAPIPCVSKLMDTLGRDNQPSPVGITIDSHLRVVGADGMYSIGDVNDSQYSKTAQVASQQAKYLAKTFSKLAILENENEELSKRGLDKKEVADAFITPFKYKQKGIVLNVNSANSVAQFPGGIEVSGAIGHSLWTMIVLYNIKTFKTKCLFILDKIKTALFGNNTF